MLVLLTTYIRPIARCFVVGCSVILVNCGHRAGRMPLGMAVSLNQSCTALVAGIGTPKIAVPAACMVTAEATYPSDNDAVL